MTSVPPGHPARRPFAQAVWVSLVTGVAFTAFAFTTTQVADVRAGSPWQNDPYDGMVSFTEFLVPALIVTMVLRCVLLRPGRPQPVFRVHQLLRSALVCLALVGATVIVDWSAVVARADRQQWDRHTPWLIGSLVPLTLLTAAGVALQRRASRLLRPLAHGRTDGDWLDDLAALLRLGTTPLPGFLRRPLRRAVAGPAIGFLRRHIVAAAAVLSLSLSLGIATIEAVGEGWDSPILVATSTLVNFGGFMAFCLVTNVVLLIAVTPARRRDPARRAARTAMVSGFVALPVSAVFRDALWSAVTDESSVDSVSVFAGIVVVSGVTVALVVFLGLFMRYRRPDHAHAPAS